MKEPIFSQLFAAEGFPVFYCKRNVKDSQWRIVLKSSATAAVSSSESNGGGGSISKISLGRID